MPTSISGRRQCPCCRTDDAARAINAMMPPSPRLSARMMSTTYFSDTTIISAQNIVESPPRMFAGLSGMPWSGEKVSLTAYSGLVPMSPKTTPKAASVRAAVDDLSETRVSILLRRSPGGRDRAHFRLCRRRGRNRGSGGRGGPLRREIQVDEIAELIGVGLAHFPHHRQRLLEGFHQLGIVLAARAARDLALRALDRQRIAEALGAGHRLEAVDDGHRPPGPGNRLALEALRVARAVPALVVREGQLPRELEQRVAVLAEALGAELGMALHALPARRGELCLLAQDLGGHAQLADIAQRRGPEHHLGDLGPRARGQGDQLGIIAQA